MHAKSLQSCLTLCDPMDCGPPGSSVHGILQARILERVVMPSPRESQPRGWTQVSRIAGGFFTVWPTREAQWARQTGRRLSATAVVGAQGPCPLCSPRKFLTCPMPATSLGLRLWRTRLQRGRPRFHPWVRKNPWRRHGNSSVLAWRIPRTEEPGGLQITGSQGVGHNWTTFTFSLGVSCPHSASRDEGKVSSNLYRLQIIILGFSQSAGEKLFYTFINSKGLYQFQSLFGKQIIFDLQPFLL